MQQRLRECEEVKRQERRRVIDRGVGKAIGKYLKQRG
jgi:hypothetical protein